MEETITYHTCTKCGEEKPITEEYFYTDKRNKNGFRSHCKICHKQEKKEHYKNNREFIKQKSSKYYHTNKDEINKKNRIKNKKPSQRFLRNKYVAERKIKDPLFKLKLRISKMIFKKIKLGGYTKNSKTHEYLDCDYQTLKEHIENQFTEGMSWDNMGEWHFDHYYPVSLAQTEDDMYIFNHYTNFQPLWSKDNLSKSNKVPDGFEEWYEMMKEKVSQ